MTRLNVFTRHVFARHQVFAYKHVFAFRHTVLKHLVARATLSLLTLISASALPAAAQDWPTRPIQIVVSSGAGGTADILARLIAEQLSPAIGQPVVMENRPGAGGHVGAASVARAKPDGYTLCSKI